jgi:hypothetical protein
MSRSMGWGDCRAAPCANHTSCSGRTSGELQGLDQRADQSRRFGRQTRVAPIKRAVVQPAVQSKRKQFELRVAKSLAKVTDRHPSSPIVLSCSRSARSLDRLLESDIPLAHFETLRYCVGTLSRVCRFLALLTLTPFTGKVL